LPKCGLVAALSAHTCSLSAKSAEFCLLAITGALHAALLPAAAASRLSVWETAMASKPLNGAAPGTAEVRFA
jgi:hypothetical protein